MVHNFNSTIYVRTGTDCKECGMRYVVVWFTDAGQHALRFPSLEQANKFKDILIADEHDDIYVAEIVEEIKK
jgi:hypothetical protein